MGRGKLPMELIAHEKSRSSTFHKRKRGLMKKLEEFTTLCDVQACMIVYGPHHDDGRPMELDVWPSDPSKVEKVLERYHLKGPEEKPRQIQDLQVFFEKRKEKISEDIVKLRRANTKAKYPGWDARIDFASVDELYQILETIDDRIYRAGVYSELLKENQRSLMMQNGALSIGPSRSDIQSMTQNTALLNNMQGGLYQMNTPLESSNSPMPDTRAIEFYTPQHYTFDQSVPQRPFNFNSLPNPTQTMMMLMNDEYQYGSSSTSRHNQYNAPSMASYCDQTSGFFENIMYNNNINTRIPPLTYYSPLSSQQQVQQQQFMQRQIIANSNKPLMIPTNSSQVNNSHLIENYPDYKKNSLRD